MDEMEAKIALDSVRWSWSFTIVALCVWGVYDFVKTGRITLPFYLLIAQNVIYFFALHIAKWRVGDEGGKRGILWSFAAVVIFLLGFGALLFFFGR